MELRKAEILFKDKPAGTFEETANGGTRFIYAPNWQTPIACTFPVLKREHEWAQGVHPFFQHLGPEGWLREKQARTAHLAEEDDFGLLLRYGADCIGAVGVRRFPDDKGKDVEPAAEVTSNPGRTVSGVQRKLLVVKDGKRFTPAGADGFAPYIAKFNSEREAVQSLVRNEALSLKWSAEVLGKNEVNEFVLDNVALLNEPALIVTRFDRKPDGTKLRLEDFAQILNKTRGRDFAGKYEASYEDVANVIKQYSARPAIDLTRLFRRLIVFALVGNCDAHLKNFSLLETDAGLRLSPAYDIVNTAFYDGFDQNFALSIGGKTLPLEQITRATFENFGKSIGLTPKAIQQCITDLKARTQRAAKFLEPPQGESPEGFVHRYQEIVNSACLRILGE
ncbi:type II toxin-antitoxin system HipA family toxin [Bradyrhizobium sp. SZCCHNRI2010]|uniref:type II toxin-antitoxin system HipA family toxin n=1 Tax=Bradyrhizobium sp. SZCCHNRI2010 TaxID=3057283 RepID=UPI0028E1E1E8|nr:HipA domain-containing protein [Bradyrhizobium sp. SZCCHNRI2010]